MLGRVLNSSSLLTELLMVNSHNISFWIVNLSKLLKSAVEISAL